VDVEAVFTRLTIKGFGDFSVICDPNGDDICWLTCAPQHLQHELDDVNQVPAPQQSPEP
jgi:hypothetical protein